MHYFVIFFSLNSHWKSRFFNVSTFIVAFSLSQTKPKIKEDLEKMKIRKEYVKRWYFFSLYKGLYIDTTEQILQQYWLNVEQIENIKQSIKPKKNYIFTVILTNVCLLSRKNFQSYSSLIFPNTSVN